MTRAATASEEAARLAALARYQILDSESEQAFDDLTLLASRICGTPIALITLLDKDRQWFKSRVGVSLTESARSVSFCTHAIQQRELYTVPDTMQDALFRDNPFVAGEPGIRFYAGAPIVTPDGYTLGTLCVLDRVPRTLTAEQAEALEALKRQVEAQLELRLHISELKASLAERERLEGEQHKLIASLRTTIDEVKKLGALVPLSSACQFDMVIPADPREIPTVTDGLLHLLRDKQWPDEEIMKVELAVQEAMANAIRHGAKGDASKHIQCCVTCDRAGEIMVVVRDPGDGFDEKAVANPLAPENMMKPSGRGIFLINELMDEVTFADGGREVQMRKKR